jgi:hypothetical protein
MGVRGQVGCDLDLDNETDDADRSHRPAQPLATPQQLPAPGVQRQDHARERQDDDGEGDSVIPICGSSKCGMATAPKNTAIMTAIATPTCCPVATRSSVRRRRANRPAESITPVCSPHTMWWNRWLSPSIAFSMLIEFADIWMMRKMLLNLRDRAEGRTPLRSSG